jgi:endo-1,4-beta-xylanase
MIAQTLLAALSVMQVNLPPANELPSSKLLRDPLVFREGTKVTSKDDWERRRAELKQLFQHYQYGTMPPTPESIKIERGEMAIDESLDARVQPITMTMAHGARTLSIEVRLILPRQERRSYPVVIRGSWGRPRAASRPSDAPASRPAPTSLPAGMLSPTDNIKLHVSRGYAIAEVPFNAIARDDRNDPRSAGVYTLFPDTDAGALIAWAWGVSRTIDALEKIGEIDAAKIVVTGHSRYGKAALVAGAFDERIAVTAPSHSGAGGAAPYRFLYGKSEALHNIVGAFPYWFHPDFAQFIDHVEQLPFDQHELRALVAPRAQLSTEGTLDAWVNPEGAQLTFEAARKVYAFLGSPDKLAIRYREVGHIPSDEDVLDFADHVFFNRPLPEEFNKLPYPIHAEAMDQPAP